MQFTYKIPRYLKFPDFFPKIAEIPNLGTNSPEVGTLPQPAALKTPWGIRGGPEASVVLPDASDPSLVL